MSPIRVFAPGKLFVVGEYAVLHGGRALVAALDAGITCEIRGADAWHLAAPDIEFEGHLDAARADARASLPAAAIAAACVEFSVDGPLAIDVRGAHAASSAKRGLGGSAATVVALIGAIAATAGSDLESRACRKRIFDTAMEVHRRHQRGRGSGADIAASVYGGWVDYTLAEGGAHVERAAMPEDLRFRAVWSGVRSDTTRAIEAFETARLARLRAGLDRFWGAVGRGDREALAREVDAYGAALEEMAGRGDGSSRIAALVSGARALGWAAKGSGAVGGDCAIAIGFASADPRALAARWLEEGAEPLDVSLDTRGVRREERHA